jgi:plastocyanin
MKQPLIALVAILTLGMVTLGAATGAFAQATPSPAAGAASHPAHIHNGTCATLGDVVQPLSDVSEQAINNGTPMAGTEQVGSPNAIPVHSSVTTVQMAFQDIVGGEHAINVHESAENIQNYIACGDVGGTMIGETDLLFGIAPLNNSGYSGVGSLHDNGDGTTTVYVYLTQAGQGGAATPQASPAASPVGGQTGDTQAGANAISLVDIAFEPNELTIAADTDVTITVTNNGALPHTFTLPDQGIDTGELAAGASADVTINLPAGEYRFICTVVGHEGAGMVGTLIVQ